MIRLYVMLSAIGFGSWPIIAGYTGLSPEWVGIFIGGMTFVAGIGYAMANWMPAIPPPPATIPAILGILAGTINGLSFIAYNLMLKHAGKESGKYVAIVAALLPIVSIIGGRIVLGGHLNLRTGLGIALISLGIWIVSS